MIDEPERIQMVTTYDRKTRKRITRRISNKTALQMMLEKGTITEEQLWVGEEFAKQWEMAHKPLGPRTMNLEAVRVDVSRKAVNFSDAQMQAQEYVKDALRGKTKAEAYLLREVCGGDRSIREITQNNKFKIGSYTVTLQYALDKEIKRWKRDGELRGYLRVKEKKKRSSMQ